MAPVPAEWPNFGTFQWSPETLVSHVNRKHIDRRQIELKVHEEANLSLTFDRFDGTRLMVASRRHSRQ